MVSSDYRVARDPHRFPQETDEVLGGLLLALAAEVHAHAKEINPHTVGALLDMALYKAGRVVANLPVCRPSDVAT